MKNTGITLIALIITIIILIIISGLSIQVITNTGLFIKTKEAKQKSEEAQAVENKITESYENEISKFFTNSRENNNSTNSYDYSWEEKNIGTWIDGKKIYRKVFNPMKDGKETENFKHTNANWSGFDILDNNEVDLIIDSKAISIRTDGYIDIMNSCLSNNNNKQSIVVNTKEKNIYLNFSQTSTFYVILEYTKTTDTETK